MAEVSLANLQSRVELLEKNFNTHLGPAYAGTSLNDPHQQQGTIDDIIARVEALETDMAAAQADIATNTAAITALQTYVYTTGRYL